MREARVISWKPNNKQQTVKTQDEKYPPCQPLFTASSAEFALSVLLLYKMCAFHIPQSWPRLVLFKQIGQYFFFIHKQHNGCPCSDIRQEVAVLPFKSHNNKHGHAIVGISEVNRCSPSEPSRLQLSHLCFAPVAQGLPLTSPCLNNALPE